LSETTKSMFGKGDKWNPGKMTEQTEHQSLNCAYGPTASSSQQVKSVIPADRFTSSITPSSPDEYLRYPQRMLGFFQGVRESKALLVSQALCGQSTHLSRDGRMEHMLYRQERLRQAEQSRVATEVDGGDLFVNIQLDPGATRQPLPLERFNKIFRR
jgi:hypothetical protein